MGRLKKKNSPHLKELNWLIEQRDKDAFITVDEYRKNILGENYKDINFNEDFAVTLEISPIPSARHTAQQTPLNPSPQGFPECLSS